MDIARIERKIKDNKYGSIEELTEDVVLMFDNAQVFTNVWFYYFILSFRNTISKALKFTKTQNFLNLFG
jgi:hypothetical protein